MATYNKSVPKSPKGDDTLEAVLDLIKFQTEDGDRLTDYQISATRVVLTFSGDD